MKFSEAIKLLEEGKKVRSKYWSDVEYIWLINGKLEDEKGYTYELDEENFDYEWEEYIEPSEKKIEKLDVKWNILDPTPNERELLQIIEVHEDKINELIERMNEYESNK